MVRQDYYNYFGIEVIDIIKKCLTKDELVGFCKGNEIKYRLRAGIKHDNYNEDIEKAIYYKKLRAEIEKGE